MPYMIQDGILRPAIPARRLQNRSTHNRSTLKSAPPGPSSYAQHVHAHEGSISRVLSHVFSSGNAEYDIGSHLTLLSRYFTLLRSGRQGGRLGSGSDIPGVYAGIPQPLGNTPQSNQRDSPWRPNGGGPCQGAVQRCSRRGDNSASKKIRWHPQEERSVQRPVLSGAVLR